MRIRIVDAFADRPFAGNPAGVVLLEGGSFPGDAWLQQVAAEVNLSETAFAHRLPAGGGADWALRWFTPTVEVDMCGHATLATAHVLRTTGAWDGPVRFSGVSGILGAAGNEDGTITLDFPAVPSRPVEVSRELAEALGAEVISLHDTGPVIGDLIAEVADERTVRGLTPDIRGLYEHSVQGVLVTAAAEDPARGHDFVSRCFFPRVGIDEDPVTGRAHTSLAPFWSARLGRTELTGLQVSSRSGVIRTEVRGDRTLLTGRAVTVIDGELLATP
ncbi:PhzF family phenazine biosynthesis protein [Streptomyces sp. CAU 1734]|uniref:PhzF family phenazine biosynthesis protein n=1 Tax=Streptomyces sp. CAU 1734 TaxID=3140360 RepID=UPI003260478E